jgi:hypothetical protein
MKVVTTRERIDEVLDGLPESELEPLLEIIVSRVNTSSEDDGETYPTVVPAFTGRAATAEEFAAFEADYGPFLPADGEG